MIVSEDKNDYYAILKNTSTAHVCFVDNAEEMLEKAAENGYQIIDFAKNMSEAQRKIFGRPYTH